MSATMGSRVLISVLAITAVQAAGCDYYSRRSTTSERRVSTPPVKPGSLAIAAGTRIRVRMEEMLDSDTTHAGHRFNTNTVDNVYAQGGQLALPRGTRIYGYVADLQKVVNRTSMRLRFDWADLPDGRRVPLDAEPPPESKIDVDAITEKGGDAAKTYLVQKGIDAVTGAVLFPVWVYMRAKKVYGFVTEDKEMIFPKGCILTIALETSAYVPPVR